jgi:uncharacterized protein (TIGR03067 family)
MRTLTLCLAAVLCLAFAPAPFPKSARTASNEDDLTKLQGRWMRVLSNGDRDHVQVTITGNRMQFPGEAGRDAWILKLDPTRKPRRIDFVHVGDKNSFFLGVYRLEGDTFTYSVRSRASEDNRPLNLDLDKRGDAWVQVYKRQR